MDVQVLRQLDPQHLADLSTLLARYEAVKHHPALAEPQREATARADLGGDGAEIVLAYDGTALAGCVFIDPALDGATALHLAISPDVHEPIRGRLLETALARPHAPHVRLWIMQAGAHDDADAAALGFEPERDLVQMRVALPLPAEMAATARPVVTRPFAPGRDDEAWLAINNAAFAGHPEQGGWTLEDLHERMQSDWFDVNGFLVADSPDGSGLIGSCWCKIHRDTDPVLGEIYVISVDPARHSAGWGRALTVAGLQWMAEQGVTHGMLYTTASNTAALTLYERLGFTIDHVDRAYLRTGNA